MTEENLLFFKMKDVNGYMKKAFDEYQVEEEKIRKEGIAFCICLRDKYSVPKKTP